MKQFKGVKDSGKRQDFSTGSVRDTADGKGQPHLLPGEAIQRIRTYQQISNPKCIIASTDRNALLNLIEKSLYTYSELYDTRDDISTDILETISFVEDLIRQEEGFYSAPYRRLSVHYQNGAKKYDPHNWRKGQPVSRYYDSAVRHYWDILDDKKDEDHEAALYWNLIAIVQTKMDVNKGIIPKELNDFPTTLDDIFSK